MRKQFKKAISLLLTMILCFGLTAVPVAAENTSSYSANLVGTVSGDTLTLDVMLNTGNEEIQAAAFVLSYDNTVVDLASGDAVDGATGISFSSKQNFYVLANAEVIGSRTGLLAQAVSFSKVKGNVNLCTIEFKFKGDATEESLNKGTIKIETDGAFRDAFKTILDVPGFVVAKTAQLQDAINVTTEVSYPNSDKGIALAAPGITVTPNDGITSGGIHVTITPTPDASYAKGYLLTLKDSDNMIVWENEVETTELEHGFWDPTVETGKAYTASVKAIAATGTDYADSAVVTSDPVVATAKPKLATPSITLEPNTNSSVAGLKYTVGAITDSTGSLSEYKIVIYDKNGTAVVTKEISKNNIAGTQYVYLTDGLTEGEPYTATVQAIAVFNGQMTDSPVSAKTAPVEAAYKALAMSSVYEGSLVVNGEVSVNLATSVSGGKAPYTYAITNGTLPAGLELDINTGVISGKLTTATTNDTVVTVTVSDSQATPDTDSNTVTFGPIAKDQGEIQVTNKNITMKYGDTIDLKPYMSVVEKIQPLANTTYKFEVTEGTDIVTVDTNGNVTALKANAGTAKVTATVVSDDAYTVADPVTFTITVERKLINIVPEAGQTKVYGKADPTPFKYTIDPATPLVAGDTLAEDILTRGGTDDVGEKEFVVKADVVNSFMYKYIFDIPADAPKFTITPANGQIVEGEGAVTEAFAITKTYGDAAFDLGGYDIANLSLLGRTFTYELTEGNDVVDVTSAGRVTILKAGTAKVTVKASDDNYNAIPTKEITITVNPKAVTVTAEDKTMVYEGTEPALTYKIDSATLEDGTKVADELNITLSRAAGDVAGTYAINVAVENNPDYAVTVEPGTFTIDKAPGQIEGTVTEDPIKIIYGDTYNLKEKISVDHKKITTFAVTEYDYSVGDNSIISVDNGVIKALKAGTTTVTVKVVNDPNFTVAEGDAVVTYNVEVVPKSITVTPDANQTKVYGDTDPAFTYKVDETQLVGSSDDLNVTLKIAAANAGEQAFEIIGWDNANYAPVLAADAPKFTITAKELEIVADKVISKAYDGDTTVDQQSVIKLKDGQLVAGDDVTLTYDAVYADKYAGADKKVNVTNIALNGDDAANYKLAAAPAVTGTITTADQPLKVQATASVVKGGTLDLNTLVTEKAEGAVITFAESSELATIENGVLKAENTLGDVDVTVNSGAINLNGDGVSEYNAATAQTMTVSIVAKQPVIVTMNGDTVTYDGNVHKLAASVPAGFDSSKITYVYTGAADGNPVDAGTYTVTATYEDATHFGTATATLKIDQREITVAMDDKTIIYNDVIPAFTYTVENAVEKDGAVVTVTPSCEATAASPVGEYTITGEVAAINSNYKLSGTVTPATLTITKDEGKVDVEADKAVYDKVYGDVDFSLGGFSISPLAAEETKYSFAVTEGKDVVTVDETGKVHILKVGTAKVTVSATDHNYNVKQTTDVTINVSPKAVTVTPVAKTKVYGEADPALTYTKSIDTLPNGEAVVLDITLTRTGDNNVGTYDIVVTEGSNPNYTITTESGVGKFTITQDEGKVDAVTEKYEKVYGDTPFSLTGFSISPLAAETKYSFAVTEGADVVTVNEAGLVTINKVGTAKVTVSAIDHNFNVTQNKVVTIEVDPRPVTVTAENKTKVYGEADPALTYTQNINTLPNGNAVALDITLSRVAGEDAGTYDIVVTEGSNPNYTINAVNGVFTISPKEVSEDMVTIDGTVAQNETLKVVVDANVTDATPSYTWKVDGTVVFTEKDYKVPYGTVGTVTLEVTLGDNYSGTIVKTVEVPKAAITADLTISPADATNGTTMTAELSNISPAVTLAESDYTITWKANGTAFATGSSVRLTTAQLGTTITAEAVSNSDSAYTFTATSNAVVIAAKAPVIQSLNTAVTRSSLTVTVDADPMGAATTYSAKLYKVADGTLENEVTMTGTSHTFDGLASSTEYKVEVTATNEVGTDVEEATATTSRRSSGGGGGGSKKPAATEKPAEDEVKLPTVTVEEVSENIDGTTENIEETVKAGEAAEAEKEMTKDAISAAKVDVDESKTTKKPAEITFDMSGEDIENPANLTLVSYTTDENGEVVMKKLGGTYDPETKTFTSVIPGDGLYGVIEEDDLLKVELQIDNHQAEVNDKAHMNDVAPVIRNDRTMVPLRFIAEAFGAVVTWNEPTKTVTIVLDGKVLTLVIDKPIEGFDVPATIMNDRTMVPIRYISESFGADVTWVGQTEQIIIVK